MTPEIVHSLGMLQSPEKVQAEFNDVSPISDCARTCSSTVPKTPSRSRSLYGSR